VSMYSLVDGGGRPPILCRRPHNCKVSWEGQEKAKIMSLGDCFINFINCARVHVWNAC
jgi:hypothetical protein